MEMVSILTTCFNGGEYIDRYAMSLLDQDYTRCQLIFMDDGSTDGSKELILAYKELFEAKGFSFEYHHHDNVGVGATIAEGIKYVRGTYLVWLDIDDKITADSISKKLEFLEENKDFGIVRTDFWKIYEDGSRPYKSRGAHQYPTRFNTDVFEDYLYDRGAWVQNGCFMVRMSSFLESNPERYIFPSRRGQNWQILLPALYRHKCGYIDEPLFYYYIHGRSHSSSAENSLFNALASYDQYEQIKCETLKRICKDSNQLSVLLHKLDIHYLRKKLTCCFRYSEFREAKKYYCALKRAGNSSLKDWMKTKRFVRFLYRIVRGDNLSEV